MEKGASAVNGSIHNHASVETFGYPGPTYSDVQRVSFFKQYGIEFKQHVLAPNAIYGLSPKGYIVVFPQDPEKEKLQFFRVGGRAHKKIK